VNNRSVDNLELDFQRSYVTARAVHLHGISDPYRFLPIFSNDTNDNHVLFSLLPPKSNSHYDLRKRHYDIQLIPKSTHLFDNKFVCCSFTLQRLLLVI